MTEGDLGTGDFKEGDLGGSSTVIINVLCRRYFPINRVLRLERPFFSFGSFRSLDSVSPVADVAAVTGAALFGGGLTREALAGGDGFTGEFGFGKADGLTGAVVD